MLEWLSTLRRWLESFPFSRHGLVGSRRLWRMKRQFQIDFLIEHGLRRTDRLCDLGCGTLRGGIPIIAYLESGNYWGIDVRPRALAEAQRELRKAGLEDKEPEILLVEELDQVECGTVFDVIWAFSTLIHMTEEVLDSALAFVQRHLASEGRLFANVVVDPEHRGQWRQFPVIGRTLAEYEALCRNRNLKMTDLGPLSSLGHVSGRPDQDAQHMLQMTPRN